ncbi:DUF2878 domain-containing protein [Arsukibacterium sp.]|uniref:DUF2878 domain-containing protein n=1 Tax=Arsukibacterium sp. TaxID=1977258 RepID=UPI00299ECD1D|nr:DUF2878 domain-containing protein [Arsukibacterium sp.]MDX1536581.1 DUF2878 domain-containing protein [Arsukibacterium sp.]
MSSIDTSTDTATVAGYLSPQRGIHWRSIIGFELAWLALVYFQSLAIVPALAYLLYGLYRLPNRPRLAVMIIAATGIVTDTLLVSLQVISFSETMLLPGWFLLIWLLFALAAVETMAGFLRPWWLGMLLGATGGPLSYLGGAALSGGILQFPLASWSFVVLVAVWGVIGVILGYSRRFYAQTVK